MAELDPERVRTEAAESQADLAHGGLPLQAQKRLAQETGEHPLFASDLSVDEFLLARSEGYRAVGQVMGSSIYHVGWQPRWLVFFVPVGGGLGAGPLPPVTSRGDAVPLRGVDSFMMMSDGNTVGCEQRW